MSSGLVMMDRAVWEHDLFRDEQYSEREAWLWLFSEAAWKPRRVRFGHGFVELQRGELTHSQRFLADKWKWSRGKVARFLKLLESEQMVSPRTDHQQTILMVCNYERFQDFYKYREPATEPRVEPTADRQQGQQRATSRASGGAKEEHQITPDKQITTGTREDFDKLTAELFEAGGSALNRTTTGLASLSVPLSWADAGCDLELDVLSTIRRLCKDASPGSFRSWKYFTEAIHQAKAERTAPPPEISNAPRKSSSDDAQRGGMLAAAQSFG